MRKHLWATLLVGAASAVSVGLSATPVAAAGHTWTVTPGGNFVTSVPGAASFLTDGSTLARFTCDGLTAQGVLATGSGLINPVGKITAVKSAVSGTAQVNCSGHGLSFGITFTHLPLDIAAIRYNATAGKVIGEIRGIAASISALSGAPACAATVDGTAAGAKDGSARFEYLNSSGLLGTFNGVTSSPLHAYNVSGCNARIRSGDVLTYKASFTIVSSPGSTVNTITSP